MKWMVLGEAIVMMVMVLMVLCQSETTDDEHPCDEDEETCQPLARIRHFYHHHGEEQHPHTSTTPAPGTNQDADTTRGPKTTLDSETFPHHDTTPDPDHVTTTDPDNVAATGLDPDSEIDNGATLDPKPEPTPGPTLDADVDPQHNDTLSHETTLDPNHEITLDSDHKTTLSPDNPLARQGTRRTKIPPSVGASEYPKPFAGNTARRPENPRPPGLPPNILYQVAFTVKRARLTRAVTRDGRLTFSEMLVNMGDAYIKSGVFFCPSDAGYFFSFHATARKGYGFTLELRRNEKQVVAALVRNGTRESGSNSVFLELNRRDLISLYLLKGGAIQEGTDAYTTFTGFLFNLRRRNEV